MQSDFRVEYPEDDSRPSTPSGFRLPPHNIEAEQGVLGGIMIDNDVIHEVVAILKPTDFYRGTHRQIYEAMLGLYDAGKPVDAVTMGDEIERLEIYPKADIDDVLALLINSIPHAANTKYHAQIVRQKAVAREVIEAGSTMIQDAYGQNMVADDLLAKAEQSVFAIADSDTAGTITPIADTMPHTLSMIHKRHTREHGPTDGLLTGLHELDDLKAGFQDEELIIVGARPSAGKTAFALNIAEHVAITRKVPVLIVSLEMGREQLNQRMLCSRSKVGGYNLRTGQGLTPDDWGRIDRAYGTLVQAPIFIDDTPSRNMFQIAAACRRLKLREKIGLIIVDYIQLVSSDQSRDSRQEEVAKISRRLKTLAREIKVPVIALSQLNRAVENREERRPRMADLRESGAIEQDADVVILLHRPEYYDPNDQPGIAEVILAKNRNGPTDTVKVAFLKKYARFENLAEGPECPAGRPEDAPF